MRLSTRSRYGMRAMLVLSLEYGRGPVMAKEIAARQNVPISYLEQLLAQLAKAQLVTSTRGAHGGYELARPPAEISAAEVLGVLEGPLDLAECKGVSCDKQPESCALRTLWQHGSAALRQAFEGVTLDRLAADQRSRSVATEAWAYSI